MGQIRNCSRLRTCAAGRLQRDRRKKTDHSSLLKSTSQMTLWHRSFTLQRHYSLDLIAQRGELLAFQTLDSGLLETTEASGSESCTHPSTPPIPDIRPRGFDWDTSTILTAARLRVRSLFVIDVRCKHGLKLAAGGKGGVRGAPVAVAFV
jgi:hypothetical protein